MMDTAIEIGFLGLDFNHALRECRMEASLLHYVSRECFLSLGLTLARRKLAFDRVSTHEQLCLAILGRAAIP